jgi:2',3'-cyclic-nucleotide 2'-phosphodiesterase (5'-nucleotidase family)
MSRLVIYLVAVMLSFASASAQDYNWKTVPMDGTRTGCKAASVDNVDKALGIVRMDGTYVSPSGKVYPKGSATAKVASIVIEAQPQMAELKKVVAYSEKEMPRLKGESDLSNWFVGIVLDKVSSLSGMKCDLGSCNFGGIRKGMPQGNVILDDIQSMFPFINYLALVQMKGGELRKLFEGMAKKHFQAIGGVSIEVVNKELVSVMIGDEPLNDSKVYNIATISFLLAGGDGLYLANNAVSVTEYKVLIFDAVMEHINALAAAGKPIVAPEVKHVTIR